MFYFIKWDIYMVGISLLHAHRVSSHACISSFTLGPARCIINEKKNLNLSMHLDMYHISDNQMITHTNSCASLDPWYLIGHEVEAMQRICVQEDCGFSVYPI
jgi:hypothetical protein